MLKYSGVRQGRGLGEKGSGNQQAIVYNIVTQEMIWYFYFRIKPHLFLLKRKLRLNEQNLEKFFQEAKAAPPIIKHDQQERPVEL